MKNEMKLYQLMDCEYEPVGLIRTDAPEIEVQKLWTYVQDPDNYTDEERQYIEQEKGSVEGYDPEELTLLLELRNVWKAEREWVTDINIVYDKRNDDSTNSQRQ